MFDLEITDDMPELEKFVRQEANAYVNSTMFLSIVARHHQNVDSVVAKGKEVTPYIMKLFQDAGGDSNENVFTFFFLNVMEGLYGQEPFDGFVGIPTCVKFWLKAYEKNKLDKLNLKPIE